MSKKVLTIRAGETKVLPKGAKVISTGTTGIVATSNCPDIQAQLMTAESYTCYSVSILSSANGDGQTNVGERIYIDGINVGGQYHSFLNSVFIKLDNDVNGTYNILTTFKAGLDSIYAEVQKLSDLNGLFLSGCTSVNDIDGNNRGFVGYLSFKTLPSIAENGGIGFVGRYSGLTGNINLFSYVTYTAYPVDKYANASVTPCPCTGTL